MDSQEISFSDVVAHQHEEDDEPFQFASQTNNFEETDENDEGATVDILEAEAGEAQESPSKRSRKYKSEIKKVTSKWLLFLTEIRPKVMKEFPQFQFAEIAGEVANRYRNISAEDSERFDAVVALDKERYKLELSDAIDDAPRSKSTTAGDSNQLPTSTLAFPLSKVRKACKADPDTKNINKDALPLITKAVELFVGFLARKCAYTVQLRGMRQIKDTDVIQTIHMTECLDFLRVDFPRKAVAPKPTPAPKLRIPTAPSTTPGVIGSGSGVGIKSKAGRPPTAQAPPVAAGKGIDKFFGGSKTSVHSDTVSIEGKRAREENQMDLGEETDAAEVAAHDDIEGVQDAEEGIEGEVTDLDEQVDIVSNDIDEE